MWIWLNSSIAHVCFLELWYCHPRPSTPVETTGNQEQLSLVFLVEQITITEHSQDNCRFERGERGWWGISWLFTVQSDSYCSQSGPFYQSQLWHLWHLALACKCCSAPVNLLHCGSAQASQWRDAHVGPYCFSWLLIAETVQCGEEAWMLVTREKPPQGLFQDHSSTCMSFIRGVTDAIGLFVGLLPSDDLTH